MPKLKTNRSANKRFRITKGYKVMRKQAFKSHILQKQSRCKKRHLSQYRFCLVGDTKNIFKMLPY